MLQRFGADIHHQDSGYPSQIVMFRRDFTSRAFDLQLRSDISEEMSCESMRPLQELIATVFFFRDVNTIMRFVNSAGDRFEERLACLGRGWESTIRSFEIGSWADHLERKSGAIVPMASFIDRRLIVYNSHSLAADQLDAMRSLSRQYEATLHAN
jgi:hypothetical protein